MNKRYDLVRLICWFGLGAIMLAAAACSGAGYAAQNDEVQTSPDGKGYRFEKDGWIYLHIEGEPYERGFQHGYLVGDELGEILRFELGLKFTGIERTKDGYFVGFNGPADPRIRNQECPGSAALYDDIRTSVGARRVRLTELIQEHHGKIDAEIAQEILGDHYDVYLKEDKPGSRNVEGHYELDPFEYWPDRLPFAPAGAVDGKVMDSDLAEGLSFWARWGSSSGMPFDAEAFLNEHKQWDYLEGYIKDRPEQPWTLFTAGEK